MRLTMSVDKNDVLDSLVDDLHRDELIELIKDVDKRMADWDFTLKLANYFGKLAEEFKRETAVTP
jgi:hypothetical protein